MIRLPVGHVPNEFEISRSIWVNQHGPIYGGILDSKRPCRKVRVQMSLDMFEECTSGREAVVSERTTN